MMNDIGNDKKQQHYIMIYENDKYSHESNIVHLML